MKHLGNKYRLTWVEYIDEKGQVRMKANGVKEIPDIDIDDLNEISLAELYAENENHFGALSEEEIQLYCNRVGIEREEFYDSYKKEAGIPTEGSGDQESNNQLKLF